MFRSIKVIAIIFLLSSCYSAKYTYQIKGDVKENMVANKEGIVIFNNNLYPDFINIVEPENSILLTKYGNKNDVVAVKVKEGRYFLPYGLLADTKYTPCFASNIYNVVFWIPITLLLAYVHITTPIFLPKIGCDVNSNEYGLFGKTNALYFDVKAGDTIYIGGINYRYFIHYLYIEDNFENDKEVLPNNIPNISKNIIKSHNKPSACNFLSNYQFDSDKKISNIKTDPNYPACIEALNKLP